MKHYAVAQIAIDDPAWVDEYVAGTTPLVERHGGRYLARTPRAARMEGERTAEGIHLLIEFPSEEAARAFYESAEYRPFRDARQAGSRGEFVLVAGEDVTGAARM